MQIIMKSVDNITLFPIFLILSTFFIADTVYVKLFLLSKL